MEGLFHKVFKFFIYLVALGIETRDFMLCYILNPFKIIFKFWDRVFH